jgi:hypothetical protein
MFVKFEWNAVKNITLVVIFMICLFISSVLKSRFIRIKGVRVISSNSMLSSNGKGPVRIRARIDSPHPFVCRKRPLNGVVLQMWRKTYAPCHSRCGTIKIPPCSKALSAEHSCGTIKIPPCSKSLSAEHRILQTFTGNYNGNYNYNSEIFLSGT